MKKYFTLKNISAIAIFSAVAVILACVPGLQFSLPFFPSFLQLHFDEIPILISTFAYGPFVGTFILIIKSLIKLPMDFGSNLGIGVLADFLYTFSLIFPAGLIYKKFHSIKGALLALGVGGICELFMSSVLGLYIIYPLYGLVYTEEAVIGMFKVVPSLSNMTSLTDPRVIYTVLIPFNLIKIAIVLFITFIIYKPIRFLIDFERKKNDTAKVKKDEEITNNNLNNK